MPGLKNCCSSDFFFLSYEDSDLEDLSLSYATTIHKSQGSEYPVTIIPIMKSAYVMLQRNLLYTAITRAKTLCIIVGDQQTLWRCVNNVVVQKCNTKLSERLLHGTKKQNILYDN